MTIEDLPIVELGFKTFGTYTDSWFINDDMYILRLYFGDNYNSKDLQNGRENLFIFESTGGSPNKPYADIGRSYFNTVQEFLLQLKSSGYPVDKLIRNHRINNLLT